MKEVLKEIEVSAALYDKPESKPQAITSLNGVLGDEITLSPKPRKSNRPKKFVTI